MNCIICNASNTTHIYKTRELNFIKCARCGVLFKKSMPTVDELTEIYNDYYVELDSELVSITMETNRQVLENYAKFITDRFKESESILDVGCGTGVLLKNYRLLNSNIKLEGLEFDNNARKVSGASFKVYENIADIEKTYDTISMIEVIEHLTDPREFLSELYNKINEHGSLIITTPNINSLKAKVQKENYTEINKPFHLVMFSEESLRILLNDIGFKDVEFVKYTPFATKNMFDLGKMRVLQFLNLYGGLFVVARK